MNGLLVIAWACIAVNVVVCIRLFLICRHLRRIGDAQFAILLWTWRHRDWPELIQIVTDAGAPSSDIKPAKRR